MSDKQAAQRIEDVRVAWERDIERSFARVTQDVRVSFDPGAADPRVALDPLVAPRVHRIAKEAAERLGFDAPYELFTTPRANRHLSAQALIGDDPFVIRLIGPVAGLLDDAALAALIGHEMGHYLALGPPAQPPSTILRARQRGVDCATASLAAAAAELTADRFSLIACRELEATVRLEVAMLLLDSPTHLGVRALEYLKQACDRVERREPRSLTVGGSMGTETRLYATWLFYRSEVFHELTGQGPADLPLREADAMLRELLEEMLRAQPPSDSWPPPVSATAPPAPVFLPAVERFGNQALDVAAQLFDGAAKLVSAVRTPARPAPRVAGFGAASVSSRSDDLDREKLDEDLAEFDDSERKFRELERLADLEARNKPRR